MRCALGLWVALPGCTAIGLFDFDIPECSGHADCAPLNTAAGVSDTACAAYYCGEDNLCRFGPRDLDRDGRGDAECQTNPVCSGARCDDCDDLSAAAAPGNREVCDGIDNDCNLLVDDVSESVPLVDPEAIVRDRSLGEAPVFGAPRTGALGEDVVFLNTAGGAPRVAALDGVVAPLPLTPMTHGSGAGGTSQVATVPGCYRYREDPVAYPEPAISPGAAGQCQTNEDCSDGTFCNGFELCNAASASADSMGCVPAPVGGPCTAGALACLEDVDACVTETLESNCTLDRLATAPYATGEWFGVGLDATGSCRAIRAGVLKLEVSGSGELSSRGDAQRSSSYAGIDIDAQGCSEASGELLAPRIAALAPSPDGATRKRPQALTVWKDGTELALVGLVQEQDLSGEVIWLHGTRPTAGDSQVAAPVRVEVGAAGSFPPAIVALDGPNPGYLVAVGTGSGAALLWVDALVDPAGVAAAPPFATSIDEFLEQRRIAPILPMPAAPIVLGTAPVLDVHLAAGSAASVDPWVGVLVATETNAEFYRVQIRSSGPEQVGEPLLFAAGRPAAGTESRWTALTALPSGFALPGFQRGGNTVSTETSGGWALAWRNRNGVVGARISALDGLLLTPERMLLSDADGRYLHLRSRFGDRFSTDRRVGADVLYVSFPEGANGALERVPVFCGPATTD